MILSTKNTTTSIWNAVHSKFSMNFMDLKKIKLQIKAPRVMPLEGVSTSTVAPVDVAHTYASTLAYVDTESRTVRFRSENPQGFGIDERRFFKSHSEKILRRRTWMTRIRLIFTDMLIRANPCSIALTQQEGSMTAGAPAHRWMPYHVYKDLGAEWLGKVPKHWAVSKNPADVAVILENLMNPSKRIEYYWFHQKEAN